jgi:hypothetical protein
MNMETFDFETKIRKVITDLFEPMDRRVMEDKELTLTLRDKFDGLARKVDDLDYLTHKSIKKSSVIEDFARMIKDIDSKHSVLETKIDSYSKTFDMHIEFLKNDF